ncbi:MAG: hypothetical protein BroJett011_70550 [Chloroflexota bacterium]|nr:MAG: hypothetical protein BroJett011_70550 [Chloroflexota bacterium]
MNSWLELLIGAILGVIATRLLDKPIERHQRAFNYWLRGMIAKFRKINVISVAQDEFRIGKWHVGWIIIEGSSSAPYIPNNIFCRVDPRPLVLPPDRQQKKDSIEEVQAQLEKANQRREFHNGATVALAGVERGQIGYTEEPFLVLRLHPSDYYTFLATAMSLDEVILTDQGKTTTVRDKYLRNLNYRYPIPEFASAISINLSLITSDGFIVVSKRATEGIGGYQGYLVPPINECVNPISDRSADGTVSLLTTAQRGASQELNIEITEDELVFFTLGVDTHQYFYEVTGLIRSKSFSRDDILARRSLGSKERWESEQLYFLRHDVEEVAEFMRNISKTDKWTPGGFVCLTQTLMVEFGTKATEQALKKYPPVRSQYKL